MNYLVKVKKYITIKISCLIYVFLKKFIIINPSLFDNKNIIIIGPARTVVDELEDIKLSDYDYIVRMNRSIDTPLLCKEENWKIDVLFHNLQESGDHDAGKITASKIKKSNIKYIICPKGDPGKTLYVVSAILRMMMRGVFVKVYMLPKDIVKNLCESLDGFSPTTGLVASTFFTKCNYKSLCVIGFTFFQTKYVDNYNDSIVSDTDAYVWSQRRNIHNTRIEAKYFGKLLSHQVDNGKNFIIGKYVEQSIANVG